MIDRASPFGGRARTASRLVVLALPVALWLLGSLAPVHAGQPCPLTEHWRSYVSGQDLVRVFGPDGEVSNDFFDNLLFDSPGDTVDRNGNPADGVDIFCKGTVVGSAEGSMYEELNLATLSGADDVVVIRPTEPGELLLNATQLIFVAVGTNALPDPVGMQLGVGFGGGSNPDYANPSFIELDGAHTWPDIFFANGQWNLDLTLFRNGAFSQEETDNIMVLVGPDWVQYIFPPEIAGDATEWRLWTFRQNVVDTLALGGFNTADFPQRSLTEAQVISTSTPAGGSATPSPGSPSASAAAAAPPAATTSDEGFPVVPVVLTGLAALAVAGGLAARMKIKDQSSRRATPGRVDFYQVTESTATQPTSVTAAAAEVIAADVAMTPLTGRAWKETAHETSRQSRGGR